MTSDAINQRIFETSLDLILIVDRRGTIIRVSPSSHTILGYRPDELTGHIASEFLYFEDLDRTREEMRQARRGRETRHFECRYVHKHGHIVTLTWTGVWSEPDEQHFFIGRDMSELKEAERRLRQSERRFQDFAEVSSDWIWETDREHRFAVLSGGGTEALPVRPSSLLGLTRWEAAKADPEHDEEWGRHKADLDARRPFRRFHYAIPAGPGQTMFISASGKPIFNDANEFVGYRGTATDETVVVEARRRAEQADALLRSAIESISEGFAIYDDEERVVMTNASYRTLFPDGEDRLVPGTRFEEVLRQGVAQGYYLDAVGREEEWIAEQLHRHRDPKGPTEYRLRNDRWVLVTKRRMANGWVATLRVDITAHKTAEAQLRQAQKMEAIGNLTGGMAHDFNNMLGVIIGNLDLLSDLRKDDADLAELTRDALDAALRGADLTRRLLAFARQQPLQPQRVDVNELIVGIIRLLSRTLGENIEVSLDLKATVWATVADPAQLEASLVNLANNSRDAMPDGGRLKFTTANRHLDVDYAMEHSEVAAGDYVLIEVSDTGTGMTPEIARRIFEPFYTTKERDKGTGLGLSMVFGFVKQSGGHISVYSEPQVGTTFRLYLPRMAEDAATHEETFVPRFARGRGETVLVVEDNQSLRRVVARQLGELGYRVIEAANAASAFDLMEREKIDLLLTDIVMPGGTDGFELAQKACDRWPALRVVFTSGFAEFQINGTPRPLPGSGRLLTKPYRREELAAIVRAALDG